MQTLGTIKGHLTRARKAAQIKDAEGCANALLRAHGSIGQVTAMERGKCVWMLELTEVECRKAMGLKTPLMQPELNGGAQ